MRRLCCGHGVYVSTGGSATGSLWEDWVVVKVSMCLLGLYYWIIVEKLCCGHGVYVSTGGSTIVLLWEDSVVVMVFVSTGGSTTGLLWEDYVVVMVSMCLLGALLLDYYGKTMLWSWCLCLYLELYYWIIMGRLCCGHGVYVSTGGSSTGLLWEDYVVVLVSMFLLGALLLEYYAKTMLW